jgi:hypothetical protein
LQAFVLRAIRDQESKKKKSKKENQKMAELKRPNKHRFPNRIIANHKSQITKEKEKGQ